VTIDEMPCSRARAGPGLAHAALYGGDPRRIVVAGTRRAASGGCSGLECKRVARPARGLVRAALAVSGISTSSRCATRRSCKALRLTPTRTACKSAYFRARIGTLHASSVSWKARNSWPNTLIRERWGADKVPVCETVPHRPPQRGDDRGRDARLHRLAKETARLAR